MKRWFIAAMAALGGCQAPFDRSNYGTVYTDTAGVAAAERYSLPGQTYTGLDAPQKSWDVTMQEFQRSNSEQANLANAWKATAAARHAWIKCAFDKSVDLVHLTNESAEAIATTALIDCDKPESRYEVSLAAVNVSPAGMPERRADLHNEVVTLVVDLRADRARHLRSAVPVPHYPKHVQGNDI